MVFQVVEGSYRNCRNKFSKWIVAIVIRRLVRETKSHNWPVNNLNEILHNWLRTFLKKFKKKSSSMLQVSIFGLQIGFWSWSNGRIFSIVNTAIWKNGQRKLGNTAGSPEIRRFFVCFKKRKLASLRINKTRVNLPRKR